MTPRDQIHAALSATPGPSTFAAHVADWLRKEYGPDAAKVAKLIQQCVEAK